jgi:hypothetical protein
VNIPNNAFFRKRIFKPFRITLGGLFVLFGAFGFLPIVGFWMIPAGLAILSIDVPWAQRVWDRGAAVYVRSVDKLSKRYPKLPWSKLPMPQPQEQTPSES